MSEEALYESYNPAFFELLFEIEDKHFWFRARNRIIAAFTRRVISGLKPNYRVLEVGCGTGNVLRILEIACPDGTVVGMDLFAEGLKYARLRTSAALVQGDMHHPPFNSCFDVIGLFDTLEHLPDDQQVLSDLRAMLREGGVLLITVPAHPNLWSYFDEASRHCRRYQSAELKHKLIEAGYKVEYITQYMMTIFPVVWAGRRLSSLRKRIFPNHGGAVADQLSTEELRPIPIMNNILAWLLGIEVCWLARGHTLPFGTSLLAVARKHK